MRQLKVTKSITNRESQSLEKYLQEIGKVNLITIDEEVKLAKRIREGDEASPDILTRERVRQIKDKAINKLRSSSKSKLLKAYLGN
jgi:RNA polymerase primary sigma factor